MPPLRDIRDHIARTPQTDPNRYPLVDYKRYPLMPTNKDTGKPYLDEATGNPIVLKNRDEEDAFKETHPDMAEIIDPEDRVDELAKLRAENERLRAEAEANKGVATGTKSVSNVDDPLTDTPLDEEREDGGSIAGLVQRPAPPPKAPPKPTGKLK